jgi:hypothetical protein
VVRRMLAIAATCGSRCRQSHPFCVRHPPSPGGGARRRRLVVVGEHVPGHGPGKAVRVGEGERFGHCAPPPRPAVRAVVRRAVLAVGRARDPGVALLVVVHDEGQRGGGAEREAGPRGRVDERRGVELDLLVHVRGVRKVGHARERPVGGARRGRLQQKEGVDLGAREGADEVEDGLEVGKRHVLRGVDAEALHAQPQEGLQVGRDFAPDGGAARGEVEQADEAAVFVL